MPLLKVICPECEEITIIEGNKDICFCSNCGAKITVRNKNEKNYESPYKNNVNDEYYIYHYRNGTTERSKKQLPKNSEKRKYVESVELPKILKIIEVKEFQNYISLTSIKIGSNLTSIYPIAFGGCTSLVSVEIPDSVTSIYNGAFYGCTSLKTVTIGSGVTSIGDWVFNGCTSLTSITVDENNQKYSSDEYGVLYDKAKTVLIQYPIGNERTSYEIPDSVTTIGDCAFDGCKKLSKVSIPKNCEIGKNAFDKKTKVIRQ